MIRHSDFNLVNGQERILESLCSVKRLRENVSNILSLNMTIDGIELVGILNKVYNREDDKVIEKLNSKESIVLEVITEKSSQEIKELYEEYKKDVILSLINAINVFDPKRISIGGSLSYFIEADLPEIVRRVNEGCFYKEPKEHIDEFDYEIVKAMLENDAGIIGAAMLEEYI